MKSVEILVMVVLGGMGSMFGSRCVRNCPDKPPRGSTCALTCMVAYAIVLDLVMIFRPEGLFGSYDFSLSTLLGAS